MLAMERMVLLLLLLLLVVLLAMLLAISSPAKAGGISRRLINMSTEGSKKQTNTKHFIAKGLPWEDWFPLTKHIKTSYLESLGGVFYNFQTSLILARGRSLAFRS